MVNAKMTAIADKIRSLLGITGKMGLDAMAANLETEKGNINAAFTSVETKGGAIPESKVSGNLANAILGIPQGPEIRKKTGTFQASGGATPVHCGCSPDLFYFTTGYYEGEFLTSGCFAFGATTEEKLNTTTWDSKYNIIDVFAVRSPTGVSLTLITYDDSWEQHSYSGNFNYVAVKYT